MNKKHGLTIGITRVDEHIFLELKAIGKLTHDDYETITPLLESAIKGVEHPQINVLIDALDFQGWELRAAWDDLKLGLKHGKEFQKMAIVGNKNWLKHAAKIGSWFIAGEAEYFDDITKAIAWLNEK
ncbi:MAG TPA: STAS/SEC14 domain-containing protein [Oceanospirillales bacterium]|nr:STAS/SEC14 domain-containing protein [Oceanospirillales bacterium]